MQFAGREYASLLPHIGAAQTREKSAIGKVASPSLCGPYQYCIYAVTGFVAMSMATAKAEAPMKEREFPVWAEAGAPVLLRSLSKRADLNGKKAHVIQRCASGRVAIKTEDGDCIRVRTQNLEPGALEETEDTPAPSEVATESEAPEIPVKACAAAVEPTCGEENGTACDSITCSGSSYQECASYYRGLVLDHARSTLTGTLMTIATLSGALVGLVETRLLTTKA